MRTKKYIVLIVLLVNTLSLERRMKMYWVQLYNTLDFVRSTFKFTHKIDVFV